MGPLRRTRTKTEYLPEMNLDLLPFSAFALESSTGPGSTHRLAQTLTLPLGLIPVHAAFGSAIADTASVGALPSGSAAPLRAAGVNAGAVVLTITF